MVVLVALVVSATGSSCTSGSSGTVGSSGTCDIFCCSGSQPCVSCSSGISRNS